MESEETEKGTLGGGQTEKVDRGGKGKGKSSMYVCMSAENKRREMAKKETVAIRVGKCKEKDERM